MRNGIDIMFICKFCGKKFEKGVSLGGHVTTCGKNPNSLNKKPFSKTRRKNISFGVRKYIKENGTYKHTEKDKKLISLKRREWLSKNKNKHNWSLYRNEKTVPEKLFERILHKKGIKYKSYYIPPNSNHNYEIDFVIIKNKIGFEINGNQHYKKDGDFTDYHKKRKFYLESLGWKIIDIHYLKCFNEKEIINIIEKCTPEAELE